MRLKEIIAGLGKLNIYEKRCISDEYDEIVFYNKDLDKWNKLFNDIFGPPFKPPGVKPTKEILALTADYGGITDNQTLFKKDFNDSTVIVMFWPWQDSIHTTLKRIVLGKIEIKPEQKPKR